MLRFFENPSDEVLLEIFKLTSYQTQASLAQVNQAFHNVSEDHSLSLFKYKSKNKIHWIGNICLMIKELEPTHWASQANTHRVSIIKNKKEIEGLSWFLSRWESEVHLGDLFNLMGKDTSLLIQKLKSTFPTKAEKSIKLLQEMLIKEQLSAKIESFVEKSRKV